MEELERKVCLLDERVKQLENENEQLKQKMGLDDPESINSKLSMKSNKSNLNFELMNIKLETSSTEEEDRLDKQTIKEFVCEDDF